MTLARLPLPTSGLRSRSTARATRPRDKDRLRILLVEDNPADARLIREFLNESRTTRFELTNAVRLDDALSLLGESAFDAVLLDLNLPDAFGLDAIAPLNNAAPDVPIVVLTGAGDPQLGDRAVRTGAQDFLIKAEADTELLTRAIRYALQRKEYERRIRHMADHDTLTQLPHGRLLRDRFRQALALSRRHKRMVALLFVDLDLFKQVNDTLGHAVGDAVLVRAARRLTRCVRASDTVARIGGDEFAVVAAEVNGDEDAARLADKVIATLQKPMRVRGHAVRISASIGISVSPRDGSDPDVLLRKADLAMYRSKREARGGYRVYASEDGLHVPRRLALMGGLRHAAERGELVLHFQPLVTLESGCVSAVEAFVRWRHPRLGLVSPGEFLPIAEEAHLIASIGEWVFREAGRQGRTWADKQFPARRVVVNLSRAQIAGGDLAVAVTNMLFETDLDPWLLELDLTGSSLAGASAAMLEHIQDVRATGVRIHYDDFGVDPCSLQRIKSLPIDGVKIDRSLIAGCAGNRGDAAVVRATIAMAHGMGLEVTAEGVESAAQLAFLTEHGCDRAQGRFFSMPLPADQL
jgi:diguanylate cyclase (GGDEF)-like protein